MTSRLAANSIFSTTCLEPRVTSHKNDSEFHRVIYTDFQFVEKSTGIEALYWQIPRVEVSDYLGDKKLDCCIPVFDLKTTDFFSFFLIDQFSSHPCIPFLILMNNKHC